MRLPETFVVDASVGVKLFLQEDGSEQAEQLFTLLGREPAHVIAVPDLFFIECANVFRSRVLRRLMAPETARQAFAILRSLPLQTVSSSEVSSEALEFALAQSLSVYDGTYVALARRLGVPLVTADRRLAGKLRQAGMKAILLSGA